MIGFKCNVGYASRYAPNNISGITFLDNDKYIIFATNINESLLYNGLSTYGTKEELIAHLESVLGKDYLYIYNAVSNFYTPPDSGYYPDIYFSTIFDMYPKTNEFCRVNYNYQPVIYIPSLNRVIMQPDPNSATCAFRVETGGSLINNYDVLAPITGNNSGGYEVRASIPYIQGYYDGADLSTLNMGYFTVMYLVYTSGNKHHSYQWNGRSSSMYSSRLFSSDSKPDIVDTIPVDDPYEPETPSRPGDLPPGTFDDTSDPIPWSPLPTLSSADTGFTRIYNPTLSQVQALARYLWTEESVLETIWNHVKQFFEDPMQAIIGFNIVPCVVPDGGAKNFTLIYRDTGVVMNAAATQFVDVDCGTLSVDRYYGSALDQSPYTKISCFLPYIGMVTLDTDEVMGTTLQVKYRIDIASGTCVAGVLVDGNLLYQYSGHCSISVPISAADFSSYTTALMSIAKLGVDAAIGAIAGGSGGSGAESAASLAALGQQTGAPTPSSSSAPVVKDTGPGGQKTISEETREVNSTGASFVGTVADVALNTVGMVMGAKHHIQHSGAFTGNSGYLGARYPYLIIERPNICKPANYQSLNGYPCMMTLVLGECSGFTKVQQVRLENVPATNPEQAEILMLLKGGVVL